MSIRKDNQCIDNEMELVEMFNSRYINNVENMTGGPPTGGPPDISSLNICKKMTSIM